MKLIITNLLLSLLVVVGSPALAHAKSDCFSILSNMRSILGLQKPKPQSPPDVWNLVEKYFNPAIFEKSRRFIKPKESALIPLILDAFDHCAKLIKAGQLQQAADFLDDFKLPSNSYFWFGAKKKRLPIPYSQISASTEGEFIKGVYALTRKNETELSPKVTELGLILIPIKPLVSSEPTELQLWALRDWIRSVLEELGHVAQLIKGQGRELGGLLSSVLISDLELKNRIISRSRSLNYQLKLNKKPLFAWVTEADIYAYMIEVLGSEFVPSWIGQFSGYETRIFIDEKFNNEIHLRTHNLD